MSFVWVPGTPLDEAALERLNQHFPRPTEPPHEGWFMSDGPTYYDWIVNNDPDEVKLNVINGYLLDTSGGIKAFPNVEKEQQQWRYSFHYLLPYLLKRYNTNYLLSDLISYFVLLYSDDIPDVYPGFRQDILNTLGSAIMWPAFWEGKDLSKALRKGNRDYWYLYGTTDFYTIFSPAMYFCLKYLSPQEIRTWCSSMFKIKGTHWHYNLLNWLYQETFTLMMHFEQDDLPQEKTIQPKGSLGVNAQIHSLSIRSDNMRLFIDMLKQNGIYYP
ncbi:MAG: hypothetical protein KC615_18690 [Anaerolineae bacterium]|nr:hypothetical protein [Anaerolineae bacterium]